MVTGQRRDEVADRIVAAYERANRGGRPRLWTIDQPAWWIPTETVAQRRALADAEKARLLARRYRLSLVPAGIVRDVTVVTSGSNDDSFVSGLSGHADTQAGQNTRGAWRLTSL